MKGYIPERTGLTKFVAQVIKDRHFAETEILSAIENAETEMLNAVLMKGQVNMVSLIGPILTLKCLT